jgi:hypothetical protein
MSLARNAWVWEPKMAGETVRLTWDLTVPAGEMQLGQWQVQVMLQSMPWAAYPPPAVELIVATQTGLELAQCELNLNGGNESFSVPAEFAEPGRYRVVLKCRSRGLTRTVFSRALQVLPSAWLQADPARDTALARAGIDPAEWRQITVSERRDAYGMQGGEAGPAWNPRHEKYNYFEWYYDKAGESAHRIAWIYEVPQADAGRRHEAAIQVCPVWGAQLRLLSADGGKLVDRTLAAGGQFRIERLRFTPAAAGPLKIEISASGAGRKFAKAANCAYIRALPKPLIR